MDASSRADSTGTPSRVPTFAPGHHQQSSAPMHPLSPRLESLRVSNEERTVAWRVDAFDGADLQWDPLLVCVAGYILTAVGRVHQLFGALEAIHLAAIAASLAIVLYLSDRGKERQSNAVPLSTVRIVGLCV